MWDPPSEPLCKLLLDLNLCSVSDLRRCARRVRKLARDLPAFDSVWLDALVQVRRLTPFQARLLESADRNRIRVGPCVLVDRLGSGPSAETFLSRPRQGGALCVTKLLRPTPSQSPEALDRLQALVRSLRPLQHPSLIGPHAFDRIGTQAVIVSKFVPGPHLGELLVRRGRFPAAVVLEIGRQLLEAIGTLHAQGLAHGDIRIANVRLTNAGVAVLVDAGVRTALDPFLTVHAGLPPDRYDTIAPELIGTNRPSDAQSDLYALGCLLWQLLAGRPPFPGNDPLGKLAAHQLKRIDDVRKLAPDTPAILAETILKWTSPQPDLRPDAAKILQLWSPPRRSGRQRLKAFRRRFDTPSGATLTISPTSAVTRWTLTVALLFALSGIAWTVAEQGGQLPSLLAIRDTLSARVRSYIDAPAVPTAPTDSTTNAVGHLSHTDRVTGPSTVTAARPAPGSAAFPLLPLPPPDEHGLIVLNAAGPYEASEIAAVGPLTIRGRPDLLPEIRIVDRPLKIWAETVKLENVHVHLPAIPASASTRLSALALIQSQTLDLESCSFQYPADLTPAALSAAEPDASRRADQPTWDGERITALAWRMLDDQDARGGRATLRNTSFIGDGPALYLASACRELSAINCLKVGLGPLTHLTAVPRPGTTLRWQLQAVTCRQSGGLLRWKRPDQWQRADAALLIEAQDCVFDVAPARGRLFEFVAAKWPASQHTSLEMTGDGSLATEGLETVGLVQFEQGLSRHLPAVPIELEGLSTGPFRFRGPPSASPADAQIDSYEAPRLSSTPPGIDPARLRIPAPLK